MAYTRKIVKKAPVKKSGAKKRPAKKKGGCNCGK